MIKKLKDLGTLKIPNRIKYSEGSKYNVADITAIDINNLFFKIQSNFFSRKKNRLKLQP